MKKHAYLAGLSLLGMSMLPSFAYGETQHEHAATTGVEALSSDLRALLTKEMQALQTGMLSIIPAQIAGEWAKIDKISQQIENSYILKQSISKQQVEELHDKLPEGFRKLDQQFHYYAGMLSHAAQSAKPELIGFYLSKLNESCVACHSQYATHKFPGFVPKQAVAEHAH